MLQLPPSRLSSCILSPDHLIRFTLFNMPRQVNTIFEAPVYQANPLSLSIQDPQYGTICEILWSTMEPHLATLQVNDIVRCKQLGGDRVIFQAVKIIKQGHVHKTGGTFVVRTRGEPTIRYPIDPRSVFSPFQPQSHPRFVGHLHRVNFEAWSGESCMITGRHDPVPLVPDWTLVGRELHEGALMILPGGSGTIYEGGLHGSRPWPVQSLANNPHEYDGCMVTFCV